VVYNIEKERDINGIKSLEVLRERIKFVNPKLDKSPHKQKGSSRNAIKSLMRPIITHSSPIWFGTSNTHSHNFPYFTGNTQIHRETNPPSLK
jgi:hypothetical protein